MQLLINGKTIQVTAAPDTPLLWVVRDEIGLTGSKFGCGAALCGACTMHVNGEAIRACVTPISDVAGKQITTIEGLTGKVADAVKGAWQTLEVAQCGYCQSGQIMQAVALLTASPKPSDAEITEAMNGNICRCGTYGRIHAGIAKAALAI